MKTSTLKKKLDVHNNTKLALAVAFSLFAIFLFVASFFLAKFVAWFILSNLIDNAETIAFWIATGFVIILVVEGLRNARYFFEQQSIDESFGAINNVLKDSQFHYDRGWLYATHVFSHFFFSAPYAILRANEEYKKIVKANDTYVQQAATAWSILKQNPKRWIPVSRLNHVGVGLLVLYKMELVWIEDEADGPVCRIADN